MPKESDAALLERIKRDVIPAVSDNWHIPRGMWKPVYGWDLDSTVSHTLHRHGMVDAIRAGNDTWENYSMRCVDDTPIGGSVALMRKLPGVHIGISGRSVCAEQLTYDWFEQHDVPIAAVLLRRDGDHMPNGKYKVRVLNALKAAGVEVRLFFEDWDEAAAQINAETGIPVVGINAFYPAKTGLAI